MVVIAVVLWKRINSVAGIAVVAGRVVVVVDLHANSWEAEGTPNPGSLTILITPQLH